MARYVVLIHGDEQKWAAMDEEELERLRAGHRDLVAAAGGAVLSTHELEPASTARTLRADAAGRPAVTDGPFLETTEAIGGFYVIEAADFEEVTRLAARLHEASASHGGVEIRRVVEPARPPAGP
jgi:hypothetical protein